MTVLQALGRMKRDISFSPKHERWISHISALQTSIISYMTTSLFLHGAAFIRYLWMIIALALALITLLHEDLNDPHQIYNKDRVKP